LVLQSSVDVALDLIDKNKVSFSPNPMSTPTRRTRSPCCARAASGHPMADPAIPLTKSRRRIASPQGSDQGIVAGQTGRREVVKTAVRNVRFGSKADMALSQI
jgi:hypothetical protein